MDQNHGCDGKMDGACGCGGKTNGGCGCGGTGVMRSFLTKKEKLELLKEYAENLERETQGVKERIKDLEKNS